MTSEIQDAHAEAAAEVVDSPAGIVSASDLTPIAAAAINGLSERHVAALRRVGITEDMLNSSAGPTPGPSPPVPKPPQNEPTGTPNSLSCDDLGPEPVGWYDPPWTKILEVTALSRSPDRNGRSIRGPAGTGKTTAMRQLVRKLRTKGHPTELFTVQCFSGFTIDNLVGQWTIRTTENGPQSEFVYGPLAAAVIYSHGNPDTIVMLACEEANMARAGVWSYANTICDGSGDKIFLPDGTSAGPTLGKFKMFLLYNEEYAGTREVNQALYTRLPPVDATYLPPGAEASMLCARTGLDSISCAHITNFAKAVRERADEHHFDLTPRQLLNWAELRTLGWSWQQSFTTEILATIGAPGSIEGQHRETIRQIALAAGLDKWN